MLQRIRTSGELCLFLQRRKVARRASVPADKNTVFIEDYSDVEDYWDTVDLDSLINTLDKLDVPSFVTDILEDFADLDGDELLENAEIHYLQQSLQWI